MHRRRALSLGDASDRSPRIESFIILFLDNTPGCSTHPIRNLCFFESIYVYIRRTTGANAHTTKRYRATVAWHQKRTQRGNTKTLEQRAPPWQAGKLGYVSTGRTARGPNSCLIRLRLGFFQVPTASTCKADRGNPDTPPFKMPASLNLSNISSFPGAANPSLPHPCLTPPNPPVGFPPTTALSSASPNPLLSRVVV